MAFKNYPLVSAEGVPIPIDILEPEEALDNIALTENPLGAAVALTSHESSLLEIWCTAECWIGFNETPVNGTTEKGIYHLRAEDPRLLVPVGAYISGITPTGETGVLKINRLVRWDSTKKDYQTESAE
jgi:hypothetical protein